MVALLSAVLGADASDERLVEVTAQTLNVRAAPSMDAPIVGLVNKHDQLVVRPVSDNWSAILNGTEINGFVSRKYVRTIERQDTTLDGPRPGEASIAPSLFAIVLVPVAIALLLRRRRRRMTGNRSSGYAARETKSANTGWPGSRRETRQVWRSFHGENRDAVLDETEQTRRIAELPVAKVDYVIDGDTVIVSASGRKMKVRLDSIDCPEDGQPWGDIATAGLIKLIGGRRVRFEAHGEDRYGRILATIYVQDRRGSEWLNVNEKMVVKGHAWVMRRYFAHLPATRQESLNRLERWARMKKVGLWGTSNPTPPWKWRRHGPSKEPGR